MRFLMVSFLSSILFFVSLSALEARSSRKSKSKKKSSKKEVCYKGKKKYGKYLMGSKFNFFIKKRCYARRMRDNRVKDTKVDTLQCDLKKGGFVMVNARESLMKKLADKNSYPTKVLKGKVIGRHGTSCIVKLP